MMTPKRRVAVTLIGLLAGGLGADQAPEHSARRGMERQSRD